MAPEKRNHFLDAEESEDDVQGYNSEDDLQKGGRSAKRHKTQDDSELEKDDDASDSEALKSDDLGKSTTSQPPRRAEAPEEDEAPDEDAEPEQDQHRATSAKPAPASLVPKSLSKKHLAATNAAIKKSGVVYLSRIPPFMKPAKLRNLLEAHGKTDRLFLAPQDPAAHKKRVKAGGNKKKLFTEGWVEFVRKKDAKRVCDLLNGQTIGGKKGNFYRDDIWTLKYLRGFKWHNLTEQIAGEAAERSNRMMAEIRAATRADELFVRDMEREMRQEGMKAKRALKQGAGGGGTASKAATASQGTREGENV